MISPILNLFFFLASHAAYMHMEPMPEGMSSCKVTRVSLGLCRDTLVVKAANVTAFFTI